MREISRALLATGRIANLPTVWSNVLGALCFAYSLSQLNITTDLVSGINLSLGLFTLIAASCIYVGGCFLGDYIDRDFDKANRPSRPLPQGVIRARVVFQIALALLVSGIFCIIQLPSFAHSVGSALVLCVIAYAVFHKKNRLIALTLMGSCRFLLILFAITAALSAPSPGTFPLTPWPIILAGCVGFYTFFLSSVAATESNNDQISFRVPLISAMLALPFTGIYLLTLSTPLSAASLPAGGVVFLVAALIYSAWILFAYSAISTSKPTFVSRALAGFCLLDACLAACISPPLTLICFILFGSALALQKLAPAT